MKYLFIHGGPGLNSNPESLLLKDDFETNGAELVVWNEPSSKRGTGKGPVSFADSGRSLIDSIRELSKQNKISVVAHSFGAFLLNEILPSVEAYLERIILIAPMSNALELDRNILKRSMHDFGPKPEAQKLKDFLTQMSSSTGFDDVRLNGLLLAASNENLNNNYWFNKEVMAPYYAHFRAPEFQFNFDSFVSIRKTTEVDRIRRKTSVETFVLYGLHDPFILAEEYEALKEFYPNSKLSLLKKSAHYPHIEEKLEFLKIIFQCSR